jgi:anti-sigma-K factor RskA
MNLGRPDRSARLDALAAQYALGTLTPRARRRLAALSRQDSAVASALRDWELRLAALADAVPGVTPPPRVWQGIRGRLGLDDGAPPRAGSARAAPWWASLSLWRGLAFAGFALAFALGVTMLAPRSERPDERIVVVLAGQDAKPALIATADRGGRFLTVKALEPVDLAPGRALELWALPEGKDPRSLGLIAASGMERIPLGAPAGIAFQSIPALAVSLEPAGGSPSGKPTGQVLYSGSVQKFY